MKDNEVSGLAIAWLCNLKNVLIKSKGKSVGIDTGYLASTSYIDRIIKTLIEQQTRIADLENQLEIERDYSSAWGDFFGYTPKELTKEEQDELRKHMKVFEEKWKNKVFEKEDD